MARAGPPLQPGQVAPITGVPVAFSCENVRMDGPACPCGHGDDYESCCGRFHDPALRWTRLAVLETREGGLFDATGTVRFRAMYVRQGQRGVLAETSRFVRQDGHWAYLGPVDRSTADPDEGGGRRRG